MSAPESSEMNQYLTFILDQELFALEIFRVREVLEFTAVTKVPRAPEFMRGVINLRGSVVPVLDLRVKLGWDRTEKTLTTCVIIVEVEVDGEKTVLGALADSVQEVLELGAGQVAPPPRLGTRLDTSFIRGMGKREGDFITILEPECVFSGVELAGLRLGEPLDAAAEAA